MAAGLFLVTRNDQLGGKGLLNGVRAVVVNNDDAETNAQHIAAAVAKCNAAFPKDSAASDDPYPADYFDTVVEISDLVAGPLKDDGDAYVFGRDVTVKVEG